MKDGVEMTMTKWIDHVSSVIVDVLVESGESLDDILAFWYGDKPIGFTEDTEWLEYQAFLAEAGDDYLAGQTELYDLMLQLEIEERKQGGM